MTSVILLSWKELLAKEQDAKDIQPARLLHDYRQILRVAPLLAPRLTLILTVLVSLVAWADDAAIEQVLGSANSKRGLTKNIRILKKSGGRVCWSPKGDLIALDRKGKDGYYDVFLIQPDGSGERCVSDGPGIAQGNNGQPAWHPSGNLLVFQSEKAGSIGHWGRDIASTPGFGGHSDLWLYDLEKKVYHQLTKTANSSNTGVLHAHFSKDGQWLSWSEMYRAGNRDHKGSAGYWKLKVAKFQYGPEGPKLSEVRTFEPGGPAFYENHGFSNDGSKLLYTSNCDAPKKTGFFRATKIYQLDLESRTVQMLAGKKYNEHALYTPDNQIVWMSGQENRRGTDYWVMNPDGSNKRRVSDFNNRKNPGFNTA